MTTREAVLVVALAIVLGAMTGLLYAGYGRPVAQQAILVAPTPTLDGRPQVFAQGLPPGTPTSEWLQPGLDVPCDRLSALVEAAMNYRYEPLWASELTEPHVVRARQIEPGAQLTRIHQVGAYSIILFEQALIVWEANDPRILVASPVNGCWQGLPQPTR